MTQTALEAQASRRVEYKNQLIEELWRGKPAAGLLSLAESAGMTAEQLDELDAKIATARADKILVDGLPKLRRKASEANAHYDTVHVNGKKEIDKIQKKIDAAYYEAEAAQRATYAPEDALRRLMCLADEGYVPADFMPNEVIRVRERAVSDDRYRKLHAIYTAANERRAAARRTVSAMEDILKTMPMTQNYQFEQRRIESQLEDAKADLKAAEAQADKAEREAEAARKS